MLLKKTLITLLWIFLVLLGIALIGGWVMFGPFVKGAMSVQKLDEGLYYMEYKGNDGFDKLLEKGGGRTSSELAEFTMWFLSKGFYPLPKPAASWTRTVSVPPSPPSPIPNMRMAIWATSGPC